MDMSVGNIVESGTTFLLKIFCSKKNIENSDLIKIIIKMKPSGKWNMEKFLSKSNKKYIKNI